MITAQNDRAVERKGVQNNPQVSENESEDTRRRNKIGHILERDQLTPKVNANITNTNRFTYERTRNEQERDLKTVEIFRERYLPFKKGGSDKPFKMHSANKLQQSTISMLLLDKVTFLNLFFKTLTILIRYLKSPGKQTK